MTHGNVRRSIWNADNSPQLPPRSTNTMSEITQTYKYSAIIAGALLAVSTVIALIGGAVGS